MGVGVFVKCDKDLEEKRKRQSPQSQTEDAEIETEGIYQSDERHRTIFRACGNGSDRRLILSSSSSSTVHWILTVFLGLSLVFSTLKILNVEKQLVAVDRELSALRESVDFLERKAEYPRSTNHEEAAELTRVKRDIQDNAICSCPMGNLPPNH